MLAALRSSPQLCTHCNKKPRHAGHLYCSKTCAKDANSTASNSSKTMCTQCNQRPKFQGFDFCGKTCARAAQGATSSQGTNTQQPSIPSVAASQKKPISKPLVPPAGPLKRAPPPSQPLSQPTKCRIDDCWEPIETDARGVKISDYCSEEHAEYVVSLLL
ncbi:hypothetical protein H0H87_001022 [Tephrocybe sp. NHM501043]|nr:hypothetical protein H0H87_001022 [Tephrocybe sp. NHM501043]